jgi:DNA invertase Pin-like site-specific DNA recombinase
MIVRYARTSTTEQMAGLEAQDRDLRAAGVERIFSEKTSSVGARPQLEAALDYLREGDSLIVSKLDRLARSRIRKNPDIAARLRSFAYNLIRAAGGSNIRNAGAPPSISTSSSNCRASIEN